MVDETIRIDRLTLRVAGLPRDEAWRFGRDVAQHCAKGIQDDKIRNSLGAVRLKVTRNPRCSNQTSLVDTLGRRILKGIGQ